MPFPFLKIIVTKNDNEKIKKGILSKMGEAIKRNFGTENE